MPTVYVRLSLCGALEEITVQCGYRFKKNFKTTSHKFSIHALNNQQIVVYNNAIV